MIPEASIVVKGDDEVMEVIGEEFLAVEDKGEEEELDGGEMLGRFGDAEC